MSEKLLSPSKSQLLGWKQDRVTLWVISSLRKKFPTLPSSMPVDSLNKANYRAGQESVLEVLEKIYDYIPEGQSD